MAYRIASQGRSRLIRIVTFAIVATGPSFGCASTTRDELATFAGEWDLAFIKEESGTVTIATSSNERIELTDAGAVMFRGPVILPPDPPYRDGGKVAVTLDLRFDPTRKKYVFNFRYGYKDYIRIADVVLESVNAKVFSGAGEYVESGMQPHPKADIEIHADENAPMWKISVPYTSGDRTYP
jgi:hypothetical protein